MEVYLLIVSELLLVQEKVLEKSKWTENFFSNDLFHGKGEVELVRENRVG